MPEGQFVVRVVSLPLPRYSLAERLQTPPVEMKPDAALHNLEASLEHARGFVAEGYGVEISGPGGINWDRDRVRYELNTPHA